jgi:hypothetical protein
MLLLFPFLFVLLRQVPLSLSRCLLPVIRSGQLMLSQLYTSVE